MHMQDDALNPKKMQVWCVDVYLTHEKVQDDVVNLKKKIQAWE